MNYQHQAAIAALTDNVPGIIVCYDAEKECINVHAVDESRYAHINTILYHLARGGVRISLFGEYDSEKKHYTIS